MRTQYSQISTGIKTNSILNYYNCSYFIIYFAALVYFTEMMYIPLESTVLSVVNIISIPGRE